jgi:hypothetical protein
MTKLIVNCETNQTIERELNAEEIAQQINDEAYIAAKQAPLIAEAEAQAIAKAELLNRLGITAEEAALLLS